MDTQYTGKENYDSTDNLERRKVFNREYVRPVIIMKHEIVKALDLAGNESILDVACGFGDFLGYVKDTGHSGRLVGVDISEGMIDKAKNTVPGVEFIVGDAQALSFTTEFDVVVCKHAMYHFNPSYEAVYSMERASKSDGRLLISLNSLEHSSRWHIEKFKYVLSNQLNRPFLDNNHIINMENYLDHFDNFQLIKELKFFGYACLNDASIFVDYMDTIKEFFYPVPSDKEWKNALHAVKSCVESEIEEKGYFREVMGSGIALFQKGPRIFGPHTWGSKY